MMKIKKDYSKLSKEELIQEILSLSKRKTYGLVWENKEEAVVKQCEKELPILEELKDKEIITNKDGLVNLLIEGDNYHALSVLNYTHQDKIDVIYIDPPYNTGNKDFKYNDRFVDNDDTFKHSKWLSFMAHRLFIAKNLLSEKGILFISIDDNEIGQLKILMDELMPNAFVTTIHVQMSTVSGQKVRAAKLGNIVKNAEYVLVYSNARNKSIGKKILWDPVEYDGHYSIFLTQQNDGTFKESTLASEIIKNEELFKLLKIVNLAKEKEGKKIFSINNLKQAYSQLPQFRDFIHNKASRIVRTDRMVVIPEEKIPKNLKKNTTYKYIHTTGKQYLFGLDNKGALKQRFLLSDKIHKADDYYETYGISSMRGDWWEGFHLDMGNVPKEGGILLLNGKKPVRLIKQLVEFVSDNNAVILDFFAGSGTTGQAVLDLNKKDNGNRRFILCTNNEGNICTEICYPRLLNVTKGLNGQDKLGGNLKYFKTNFIEAEPTDKNKKKLTQKATEMLCIKENTFKLAFEGDKFKVFTDNKSKYTGIIYDQMAIDDFKKAIAEIKGSFSVYIFSLGDDTFDEEFADLKQKIAISPIPESILRVYKRIFK